MLAINIHASISTNIVRIGCKFPNTYVYSSVPIYFLCLVDDLPQKHVLFLSQPFFIPG